MKYKHAVIFNDKLYRAGTEVPVVEKTKADTEDVKATEADAPADNSEANTDIAKNDADDAPVAKTVKRKRSAKAETND